MLIDGINVIADPEITNEEITSLLHEERSLWAQQNKTLGRIELTLEEDNIVIHAIEKSPIRRVRRITGYLSELTNFNDAKRAEFHDRVEHTM